ncbi:TPA: phage tail spike protein [Streptococcus suis]
MIYLFDKDEKLIKIVRKSAVKTALQKYALTTERYVSDRLTVELKGLNADELEQVEYMAIQTMEDAHTFHYFYVAQKFSDSLTTLIGVQSGIEELRKSPVFDKRPKNALARDVITDLLAGTNWQARFVGETTPHSTNFYYTSIFEALKKVCEVWDLEMQFFVEMNGNRIGARYIDFKQRIGEAVGKRVVYGHNALQILQEVERTNIFTALVGRGKGEETGDGYGRKITFEDVVWSRTRGKPVDKPKGQKYLELPLMTRQYGIKNADGSMRPKIGFVDFSEEENPEVLIERTYRALVDAARPQLTLKTSSVYLRGVKVGDTIRVVRHDKKLDYDTRIFEITFNRLNNQSSDIKLGDRIGESNEAKVQTIADKAVEQFVNNEFSNFVQNLPDYLPSADGFNNNWYGTEDPTVKYPGKVLINDIWFKPDPEHEGHKIMLRWTGEVWEEILRTYESEALRDRIAEEIAQVEQSMQANESKRQKQIDELLLKAGVNKELAEEAKRIGEQAKTDAANVLSKSLQYKNEAIAEATRLDTVERQATETKLATTKSQAISEATRLVETAKSLLSGQISNISTDLSQTKEAIKLLATKATVDMLTGRVSSAETMIQVQADQISQRVKTSDFDQAKQRISTAESSITQLGNRITTEISEVSTKLDNFKVGSRNYAEDYDFSRGLWEYSQEDSSPRNTNFTNGVYTLTTTTNSWHQLQIYSESGSRLGGKADSTALLEPKVGEIYTLSVEVKVNSGSPKFWLELRDNGLANYNAVVTHLGGNITATSEWVRYSVTGTIKPNSDFSHRRIILGYNGIGSLSFRKVELTQSSNFTDAGPAPEDTLTEIENAKTTITQTASGVEQLSTKLTETADKVTSAETSIRKLVNDVSSKVSQTTFDNLRKTVDSQGTAITQNQSAIALKAEKTYVDGVKTTADSALSKANANADSIRTTKAELKVTSDAVATKVSQSDFNAVDQRLTSAETTISTQAGLIEQRLTSTQVDAAIVDKGYQTATQVNNAITSKGYQTKSDVDSNITGRGYITNSALQPYALSTTVQNLVKETSDSFSRTISETRALIPTEVGSRNLIRGSAEMVIGSGRWTDGTFRKSGTGTIKTINISNPPVPNVTKGIEVEITSATECGIAQDTLFMPKGTYTFTVWVKGPIGATGRFDTFNGNSSSSKIFRLTGGWDRLSVTSTSTVDETKNISYVYLMTSPRYPAKMHIVAPKLEAGPIPTAWSPAPEDLATVTALHNVSDTVDSHTRTISTINGTVSTLVQTANGLVAEVSGTNGLKSQVSQLKDSWAVKLSGPAGLKTTINASDDGIRLLGRNIRIDGNALIDNAVITSAMIAGLDAGKINTGELNAARIKANSIDGSKIVFDQALFNKLTSNEAYLQQLFAKDAFLTAVQAVSISASQITGGLMRATSGAMIIDLNNALTEYRERATIKFNSAGNVLYREKKHPRGHNTIGALMFKDSNGGGVMTALGNTSHQTIDSMRNNYGEGGLTGSFAGIRIVRDDADTQRDRVDIIADRIIMAHSTNFQESTNSGFYFYPTAVRGWWNLGAILQNISNKFKEHGWGEIGDIYNLGYTAETTPSQYT